VTALPQSRCRADAPAALIPGVGPPNTSTTVLTSFHLSDSAYGLNQLRYDPGKLKRHGLCSIEDTGSIAPERMRERRLSGRTPAVLSVSRLMAGIGASFSFPLAPAEVG
jgi:hypothetical protein